MKASLVKHGKEWKAMDSGEDDTPHDFDVDPTYGEKLSATKDPSLFDGKRKPHKPDVTWADDESDPEPEPDILEADDIQHEAFDKYISAKVCLPRSGNMAIGTVKKRSKDGDGNLVGKSNANPLMDTAVYEVEFADGQTEAYTANIIAEHLLSS